MLRTIKLYSTLRQSCVLSPSHSFPSSLPVPSVVRSLFHDARRRHGQRPALLGDGVDGRDDGRLLRVVVPAEDIEEDVVIIRQIADGMMRPNGRIKVQHPETVVYRMLC